jgi:hypothetical protein
VFCFHGITEASQGCTRIDVGHSSVGDWKSKSETEKFFSARASDEVLNRRKKITKDMKRLDKVCRV